MYEALLRRDKSFEGVFVVGVTTTGIFCKPTCHARKPKKENVEFFSSTRDAILKGYRPCKVCEPLNAGARFPDGFDRVMKSLSADPGASYSDRRLREMGLEPGIVRRWFQKHHGITFQSYQRILRINAALCRLQKGESIPSVAFDSGYDSLSGFNSSFKSVAGISPRQSRRQTLIQFSKFETPLGIMYACSTDTGICLLEFADRKSLETELKMLSKLLNGIVFPGESEFILQLRKEVDEYFNGKRKKFTVPLCMPGTEFQKRVWEGLLKVEYGTTHSYKEQAILLGRPSSVRAVANANGMNRIAILVPCHRIIGEGGNLTGYGGGLWRKKFLLDLEKNYSGKRMKGQQELHFEEPPK